MEMCIKFYQVTGKEQQCTWIRVTQEFHCFAEHTLLFVGVIREATVFIIHIERMRFSLRISIGTCHFMVRRWRKVA